MTKELSTGDKAPAWKGQTLQGPLSSTDLKGAPYVLYFYPKDNTPGCTKEACGFQDSLAAFRRRNIQVIGVSKDSLKSHEKFSDKYDLSFPLVSDEDGAICESFGVWVEKSLYGRKYMGIDRATFLIDEKGIIQAVWRKVKVAGHIDAVMNSTKNL